MNWSNDDVARLRSNAASLLLQFEKLENVDAEAQGRTLRLLRTSENPFDFCNFEPGHITASAVILTDDGFLLLVFHPALKKWIQPGGHVERTDRSIVAVATREAREETGVDLEPNMAVLFGLDIHKIPREWRSPEHEHFDFQFLFRIRAKLPIVGAAERCEWRALEELRESAILPSLATIVYRFLNPMQGDGERRNPKSRPEAHRR